MKSNMTIQVDFLSGTDIRDAIAEAKAFSAKMDIAYTTFKFNSISMSIGRYADVEECVEHFQSALGKDSVIKHVVAR